MFCQWCGAAVARTGATTPSPTRPGPSRQLWVATLVVWVVALVVVAAVGGVRGWRFVDSSGSESVYPSADQATVIKDHGQPGLFVVGDGPVKPGGEQHRLETWMYTKDAISYSFVDGQLVGSADIMADAFPPDCPEKLSPSTLRSTMTLRQVEALLEEEGTYVADVDSPYPGCKPYDFPKHRLAVSFVDGRLFTAQSY